MHEVETMFSGRLITPWHGEGNLIEGTATTAEAIEQSGLDWRVRLEDLRLRESEWQTAEQDEQFRHKAVVRESDARILGVVGEKWVPVQNKDLFAIGDALRVNGARWETAGSLRNGARVWALMSLNEDDEGDEIVPGDRVMTYLLLGNGHDGGAAASACVTTVRVVCMNTFRCAMGQRANALKFKVRHTGDPTLRLAEAGEMLLAARTQREQFAEAARAMAGCRMTDAQRIAFFCKALGIDEDPEERTATMSRRLDVAKGLLTMERNLTAPGSLWQAFNVITDMTSNSEGEFSRSKPGSIERLASQVSGTADAVNQSAWTAAQGILATV